jgi:hypothetical protein
MANESSNESSLFPSSDGEREDSGLQDILSVAAKIKDKSDDPLEDSDMSSEDSGMIVFTAGPTEGEGDGDDDDGALFASFEGGLGAGFETTADPLSADVTPLSPSSSVSEARPAEATAKPAEEPKRNPLVAVAVVLGLALAGGAAVMLTSNGGTPQQQPQAQAEMSAQEDAAVGKAEPDPEVEPAEGGAGVAAVEPEPEPELDTEGEVGETEGILGADTEGLLADGDDPMAMREGLLESDGSNGVRKAGKWDQGKSYAKPESGSDPKPDPVPEPDPVPKADPEPDPIKPASGGSGASDEEVDCLLNPDLPKCQKSGTSQPKEREILAPKLPDKLSSSQLRNGFNKVKGSAKKCGLQNGVPPGTKVKVHVSIEGATGKVSSVKALGEHAGTPLGKCVEDAVSKAQFEQFKKPVMGIDYPIIM